MRADAQENYERIVDAALRVFNREGPEASLKAIAEEAGVGIGTLYRRFPTREQLVAAVYRNKVMLICATAPEIASASTDPVDAARAWMNRFVGLLITKHGMPEAMKPVLTGTSDVPVETRDSMLAAVNLLMNNGFDNKVARNEVSALDVMQSLCGIGHVASDRQQASRLIELLIAGLCNANWPHGEQLP